MKIVFHLKTSDIEKCKDIHRFQKCDKIELIFAEDIPSKTLSDFIDEDISVVYVTDFSIECLDDYFRNREEEYDTTDTYDSLFDYQIVA